MRSSVHGKNQVSSLYCSVGRAQVKEIFNISKVGTIAGSVVIEGTIKRTSNVRLLRDSAIVHDGTLSSLKRFKDDVKEVQSGQDCGIGIENFNDVKVGDIIEFYETEEIKVTL